MYLCSFDVDNLADFESAADDEVLKFQMKVNLIVLILSSGGWIMKQKLFFVLALTTFVFVGCNTESRSDEITILNIPAEYQGWTNPQGGTDVVAAGESIYEVNCSPCHGETGYGDGPAGKSLTPAPVNFHDLYPLVEEDYYYYVIREGVPGTSMVPWKDTLNEEELYQVIAYVREFK